jgi:hypothetical protein
MRPDNTRILLALARTNRELENYGTVRLQYAEDLYEEFWEAASVDQVTTRPTSMLRFSADAYGAY